MKFSVLAPLAFFGTALAVDDKYLGVKKTTISGDNPPPLNHFGSVATYDDGTTFSDDNLIMIAKQGFQEMEDAWTVIGKKKRPLVMTALLVKNQIWLSSSGKIGAYSFGMNLADQNVQDALTRCIVATSPPVVNGDEYQTSHNTGGNCGEQLAAHFYYTANPDSNLKDLTGDDQAVVVTVERRNPNQDSAGQLCIKDPCAMTLGGPDGSDQSLFSRFGCSYFNQAMGWRTVDGGDSDDTLCSDRDISDARPTETEGYTFSINSS